MTIDEYCYTGCNSNLTLGVKTLPGKPFLAETVYLCCICLSYFLPLYPLKAFSFLLFPIPSPYNPSPTPWPPADPPDNSPAGVLYLLTNLLWLELTSLHRYLLHPGDDLILALHPALPTLDHPTQLARDPLTPGLWLGAPHCSALYVASVH